MTRTLSPGFCSQPERHVIGKAYTITLEHDNSNTRHHLGRMSRSTKVVSKKTADDLRCHQALVGAYHAGVVPTISGPILSYLM